MPAFTFEKITPPVRLESGEPVAIVRRGALMRFIDRLTSARLQKSEGDINKVERKSKSRKQR